MSELLYVYMSPMFSEQIVISIFIRSAFLLLCERFCLNVKIGSNEMSHKIDINGFKIVSSHLAQ